MTKGLGNPDWQRRYSTSAVAIYAADYLDSGNHVSGALDTNGFQYLIVSMNNATSTTYSHVQVHWFEDAALTLQLGTTDCTIPPHQFSVLKAPVVTRFYTVEVDAVPASTGNPVHITVYGTNADQENLLTQNTSQPTYRFSGSIAAGATQTTLVPGMFGGEAMITNDDSVNNKWTGWLEYYDWSTMGWLQFWSVHGTDKGQTWVERVFLPYAPIRANIRNDDTVAHPLTQCLILP